MKYFHFLMLRPLLIFWLIVYSIRYRTRPWNFFQLNSAYFNGNKNIFSKLDMDQIIPARWQLHQVVDNIETNPEFPVFSKPEWGQNSHGVARAENEVELQGIRERRATEEVTFLLQEAATEGREFEVFYVRLTEDIDQFAVLSITETVNRSSEHLPVNGVRNRDTYYRDRTDEYTENELLVIWKMMNEIGSFKIARVGLKANSKEDFLQGTFHVIEVNVFLPMPLMLLDNLQSWSTKHSFVQKSMRSAARLVKNRVRQGRRYPIFWKQLVAHYKVKE